MKGLGRRFYGYIRREPATAILTSLGVLVALGLFLQNEDTANRVTILERSPCQTNPRSARCQQIKVQSDRERSVRSACVITNKAGLGCPALEDGRRQREGVDDDPGGNPSPGQPGPAPGPTPTNPTRPGNAVGVDAPSLPIQVCLPPLAGVNCD